jgi:two-component system sensor histidine kinase/response regulator
MSEPDTAPLASGDDGASSTAGGSSSEHDVARLQAENARLAGELTRMAQSNQLLAGILSHDLLNPLGAILMSATVLSRKVGDDNVKRAVGRILTAGQRLNLMIEQLRDFIQTRAPEGLPIERACIDAAMVFRRAIDDLTGSAVEGRAVRLEHEGDTRGWWDAKRLAQVACNLIGNALQHGTDGGGVVVRIDGSNPARVTIEVSNAGTIPLDLLPIVWEPFQSGELRSRRGGLGLGLFITKQIVSAHAGTLAVASAGESTTFIVGLPRRN